MKTFKEFLSEDAASDTQATIAGDDTRGTSGTFGGPVSRKQQSVLDYFKRKKKDNNGGGQDQETSQEKPDGPGKQPDRKPQPYRSSKPQRTLPQGKERPALPASKDSMVARRTASSKQPPQHKQISARPASTAMAGSRQRPAIRPAKSNLSRDNMGVQKVNVQDLGPSTQKRLNPARSNQKRLPPAGFRAKDLRARG
jgi:hypothetical protein